MKSLSRKIALSLTAAGVILLGVAAFQIWGTNIITDLVVGNERIAIQEQFSETLSKTRQLPHKAGEPFGLVTIPSLGLNSYPLIEGIENAELAKGIGHYPETQLPGEVGNFAIAGHRATHGEPFANFQDLKAGDQVIVETVDVIYVYSLEADIKVVPTGTWVLDANPHALPIDLSRKLITLTTCDPKWNSTHRWVWWGSLTEVQEKWH